LTEIYLTMKVIQSACVYQFFLINLSAHLLLNWFNMVTRL